MYLYTHAYPHKLSFQISSICKVMAVIIEVLGICVELTVVKPKNGVWHSHLSYHLSSLLYLHINMWKADIPLVKVSESAFHLSHFGQFCRISWKLSDFSVRLVWQGHYFPIGHFWRLHLVTLCLKGKPVIMDVSTQLHVYED